MKYKIHYKDIDEIIIESENIEELRGLAISECAKRNWDSEDCWSEEIK